MQYYLGIDIGASSGRHMLGHMEKGKIILEEVYRFENRLCRIHGKDCWDIDHLFDEVIQGIKKCVDMKKIPVSLSIDTWACDFVLVDEIGKRLCDCVSYRDDWVNGMMEEAFTKMDKRTLYEKTGIQFQKFNTLYQLMALQKENSDILKKAKHFLMVPDYLMYRLTGIYTNEYTNASTTQMVNVHTQMWDDEILDTFDIPKNIFHEFIKPGDVIGCLREDIAKMVGAHMKVIACATHDTASAYSVVEKQNEAILSSGTWSLFGTILEKPITSEQAMAQNFTNEGAYDGNYRFLKNIMGLWMIQEVRHCLNDAYSFKELVELAKACDAEAIIVDVNDSCFLHPENMIKAIQDYCIRHHLIVPKSPGEIAKCVYHSLAFSYGEALKKLSLLCGKNFHTIHVVGGGSKNQLLNELIEEYTKAHVVIGPDEASVLGNIMIQMGGR